MFLELLCLIFFIPRDVAKLKRSAEHTEIGSTFLCNLNKFHVFMLDLIFESSEIVCHLAAFRELRFRSSLYLLFF